MQNNEQNRASYTIYGSLNFIVMYFGNKILNFTVDGNYFISIKYFCYVFLCHTVWTLFTFLEIKYRYLLQSSIVPTYKSVPVAISSYGPSSFFCSLYYSFINEVAFQIHHDISSWLMCMSQSHYVQQKL